MSRSAVKRGQALIEVLFSVGVVALCLVGLVVAVVAAVKNTRFAKDSTLAKKYAQEGLEEARKARDRASSWNAFLGASDTCEDVGIFERCIDYETEAGDERRKVTVTVSWTEGGRTHQAEAITFLTKWSRDD